MSSCIERDAREICNVSYMNQNKKIKLNYWYKKTNPPIGITADFKRRNVLVDDPQGRTLFTNKPVGVGYNI